MNVCITPHLYTVLRESPIWTEWSSHALGFGSPTVSISSQSY